MLLFLNKLCSLSSGILSVSLSMWVSSWLWVISPSMVTWELSVSGVVDILNWWRENHLSELVESVLIVLDVVLNTRNGELPGHHRWGDHPEPGVNIHAEADAKDAKAKADKAAEEKKQTEASKKSFVQTGELSNWGMVLTSSENMEKYELLQTGSTFKANDNEIFDADGDGVEDNVQYTHGELDNFFFPTVFNTAEDVYNTRHGNYPGHRQKEFYDAQSPPESMELVKGAW